MKLAAARSTRKAGRRALNDSIDVDPTQNRLIRALPATEWERIAPHLQLVRLPLGKVLYEAGQIPQHVYFPADAIVSLLYVTRDGASGEIAVIGNDGMLGISLLMGGESTLSRAVVQGAGYAYRVPGRTIKEEFRRAQVLQILLLRYTQCLITQMS